MKRIILAAGLIAVLFSMSLISLFLLKKNSADIMRYSVEIEELCNDENYDEALKKAQEFLDYWEKSALNLNILVDTDRISAINSSVYRIAPLIESDCDELGAELETIRANALWLYECEKAVWYNIF